MVDLVTVRASVSAFLGLALVGGLLLGPAKADARPLDSRRARRALELALQAELAGDAKGAREALEALLSASESPRETAGRELLRDYLASLPARARAWEPEASGAEVLVAWASLEPFGPRLADRAWVHLVGARPALAAALPAVHLRVDRATGVEVEAARAALESALAARDIALREEAGLELSVDLDLGDVEKRGARIQVTGRVDAILTTTTAPPKVVARASRSRWSVRRSRSAARESALRRLALDVAEGTRWAARKLAIARVWGVADF